jgi:hypothetical protein
MFEAGSTYVSRTILAPSLSLGRSVRPEQHLAMFQWLLPTLWLFLEVVLSVMALGFVSSSERPSRVVLSLLITDYYRVRPA